ncbi:MAG: hypothetical protein ACW967_08615 [Candidatus Hodarchaeales archaeon]|jgi:hypothetical protein
MIIFATIISLNTGKVLSYKPINEANLENFQGFGKPNSLKDFSNGYFLHDYSTENQNLYVHTQNFDNFVIGVLNDKKESCKSTIHKLWKKFEEFLSTIDEIDFESSEIEESLFKPFEEKIEKILGNAN